jgi:tRNA A-37 threonylcarbamoyl transferase component Bud32
MIITVARSDERSEDLSQIYNYILSENITVSMLEVQVCSINKIPEGFMHLEHSIYDTKVILTDSFQLDDIFSGKETENIEIIRYPIQDDIFYKLIAFMKHKELTGFNSILKKDEYNEIILFDTVNEKKWNIMHFTAVWGTIEMLESVIKLFEKWDKSDKRREEQTEEGWTPFLLSCAHGRYDLCKFLLTKPWVKPNLVTKVGSALHLATKFGFQNIVNLLLENGANYRIEDCSGKISMHYARRTKVCQLLGEAEWNRVLNESKKHGEVTLIENNSEKQVIMDINTTYNLLSLYNTEDDYLYANKAIIELNLMDINNIDLDFLVQDHQEQYYFVISTRAKQYYRFACSSENKQADWISVILDNVCRCNSEISSDSINCNKRFYNDEFPKIERPRELYLKMTKIAKGRYTNVYKVIKKDSKKTYALKRIKFPRIKNNDLNDQSLDEIKIMSKISHPFIVQLYDWFKTASNKIVLILEYCDKGSLESLLSTLDKEQIISYMAEIVMAVEYLHNNKVLHRDIKPDNILLGNDGHIRLADFGLSRNLIDNRKCITFVGTKLYMAPEIYQHKEYAEEVDVYSLGITLHKLLCQMLPYESLIQENVLEDIVEGNFYINPGLSPDAIDLFVKMTDLDPQRRLKITEVKKHRFFKGINWGEFRYLEHWHKNRANMN